MITIYFTASGCFDVDEEEADNYEVGQEIELTEHLDELTGCCVVEIEK